MRSLKYPDGIRQALNVLFAVTQILAGYVLMALDIGMGVGEQSNGSETPVIPAGYAFSIWGLIFGLFLAYAIWQALPKQKANPLLRRVGWLTAAAFFMCTVWELVAQLITFNWPTAVIIVGILIPALAATFRLARYGRKQKITSAEIVLVYVPTGILAAWVTVATFANVSSVMAQQGFPWSGSAGTATAIVFLAGAAIVAAWVLWKIRGSAPYALTILWAYAAIIAANVYRLPNTAAALSAAILALIVLAIAIAARPHSHA